MVGKDKIAELNKAIKDTQTELTKVRQEKQAAANNPEQLVLAEKKERRIYGQLKSLENAKTVAEYTPPEPTDRAELLQPLQRYYDEKTAKVRKVEQSIKDTEQEQRETANAIQQAAKDCDTEKTVELSEKRTELNSKLKHLQEMCQRVNDLPVFPDGAIMEEWSAICEKTLPDWQKAALRVEILAAEYTTACRDLLQMHDTLKIVREDIRRKVEREGYAPPIFSPVFTVGLDSSRLTVSKGDYIQLAGIEKPISGTAL